LTQKCSNAEVEAVAKDWLRLAKDRDGGRRARMQQTTTAGVGGEGGVDHVLTAQDENTITDESVASD